MTDNFYTSEGINEDTPLMETKVSLKHILIAIGLAVVFTIIIAIGINYLGLGGTPSSAQVKSEPASETQNLLLKPVVISDLLNDKVFKYNGTLWVDGKQYNVSLRVEGLSATDAFNIIRKLGTGV